MCTLTPLRNLLHYDCPDTITWVLAYFPKMYLDTDRCALLFDITTMPDPDIQW